MPAPNEKELCSPYAPIRLRSTPWWLYAKAMANQHWVTAQGEIETRLPERIMTELINPYIEAFANTLQGEPHAGAILGHFVADMYSTRHWVPLIGQYLGNGNQIFDLADPLVESLNHTDVKDATLEGLQLPYEAFYMRFGKQPSMRLPFRTEPDAQDESDPWEYFDGAFVARTRWPDPPLGRHRIVFGLTTVLGNGVGRQVPGLIFDFQPEELLLPALEAIEVSLKRRVSEIIKSAEGGSANTVAIAGYQRARYEESADLMRQAMPLVLNGLFYLESLEGKFDTRPGRDASSEWTVRWANSPPAKRHKLQSRLTSEGYTVVHLVGQELGSVGPAAARGASTPHWRRGHWRMQPYGEGRSLRKRIRIAAQFINPHQAPTIDVPGHIYVPGSERSQ